MEDMPRDGKSADEPMGMEVRPGTCAMPIVTPAWIPDAGPTLGGTGPLRRMSGKSEVGGMTADLGTPAPAPAVATPNEPSNAAQFYDDMLYAGLQTLCKQRGSPNRGPRSLLTARRRRIISIEEER